MRDTSNFTDPFVEIHLEAFSASKPLELNRNDSGGKIPRTFAGGFLGAVPSALSEKTVGHDYVVDLVKSELNTITVCAAILAWGGMHINNRDAFTKGKNYQWLPECEKIRDGTYSRREAFEKLKALRDEGSLKGLGCAFFTKLIYFLQFSEHAQKPAGYIMDQWASESINVLTGKDIVKLDKAWTTKWKSRNSTTPILATSSIVSDKNDATNYEDFCAAMDQLAVHAAADPQKPLTRPEVDRGVMGGSKDKETCWREYLLDYRAKQCSIEFEHG
jgi:hypothetical protein